MQTERSSNSESEMDGGCGVWLSEEKKVGVFLRLHTHTIAVAMMETRLTLFYVKSEVHFAQKDLAMLKQRLCILINLYMVLPSGKDHESQASVRYGLFCPISI